MRFKPASLLIIFLLIVIAATSITGCSNSNKFSKYGFSFEYPEGFRTAVSPLLSPDPNDDSGIVEARFIDIQYKSFQVVWDQRPKEQYQSTDTLKNDLSELIDYLESQFLVDVEKSQIVETTLNGHPFFYLIYKMFPHEEEMEPEYGVQAILYCYTSEKWFGLRTFCDTYATDTLLVEDFMSFANTFICHQ